MQADDDNENEDGAVEGLVDLGLANPYQGAPIHREEQFRNNCSDFTSKPAKNQGKWRKTRETSRCNFL
ncbi:unnamed protein product [Bathycoccus prasinos]